MELNYVVNPIKIGSADKQEIKILTANPMEQTYTPSVTDYEVLIIHNMDKRLPIEFTLDSDFYGINDDVNTFRNIHRLEAGQVIKVRKSVTSIKYRSLAGMPKIKVICGLDAELTSTPNEALFDVKMLRRAVMAVDRMSDKVFAGSGTKIYKSIDNGITWSTPYTFTDGLYATNMFYTKNNTLLVWASNKKLYRSTDDGTTLTEVLSNVWNLRASDSIAQNTETGTIVIGENPSAAPTGSNIRLLRSTNDGQTWTTVLTRTREQIRHFHSVQIDPYTREWIATTGDLDDEVEWWKSSDDGITWTAILGADSGVQGNQVYRILGFIFTDDSYIFASDNPIWSVNTNFIASCPKDNVANISKGMTLGAPAYAHYQVGNKFIIGTIPEGASMADKKAKLYVSLDSGKTWEEVISWRIDSSKSRGGFSCALPPDAEGNIYIQTDGLIGCGVAPWSYKTLRISFN